MKTNRQFSLYYTEREMATWRKYATSRGMPVGTAIKELVQKGLEAAALGQVAESLMKQNDLILKFVIENAVGSRAQIQRIDPAGTMSQSVRDAAGKLYKQNSNLP